MIIKKQIKGFSKHLSAVKLKMLIFYSLSSEVATGGVLRNFAKFAGKHLCQSLFFNKVAGWDLLL